MHLDSLFRIPRENPHALDVALVVPRTEAEGPGHRFALWVQGCHFRCAGCCNPDFLPFEGGTRTGTDTLLAQALAADVEGVSFLGGEPFAQAEALGELAEGVRAAGRSVMVFSGYTLAELRALPKAARLLAATDLLVDGRFEATLRTTERRWVGSTNQMMHFLTGRYDPSDPRFAEANQVEIRMTNGVITMNGWPLYGARSLVRKMTR